MPQKSILITGCSQHGIGAGLASEAASRGYTVFAGLRNPSKAPPELQQLSNVTLVSLDVTSSSSIAAAVKTVTSATNDKGLDVLVNNAGSGLCGPLADTETEDAKALFETNVFGAIAVTKAFLPLLVTAQGVVLNNSSLSGMLWMPWAGRYSTFFPERKRCTPLPTPGHRCVRKLPKSQTDPPQASTPQQKQPSAHGAKHCVSNSSPWASASSRYRPAPCSPRSRATWRTSRCRRTAGTNRSKPPLPSGRRARCIRGARRRRCSARRLWIMLRSAGRGDWFLRACCRGSLSLRLDICRGGRW